MPGNRIGGKRAAKRNKDLYGDDFYARIGAKGGKATGMKGFAVNRDLARKAGAIGGRKSRRGKKATVQVDAPIATTQDDVTLAA
jgi:uncharacterized protein